jgi:hypothetical protein
VKMRFGFGGMQRKHSHPQARAVVLLAACNARCSAADCSRPRIRGGRYWRRRDVVLLLLRCHEQRPVGWRR